MTGSYATAITVIALMLAAWTLVLVAMNRPPAVSLLAGGGVLEAMLVGFLVGGIVQMVGSCWVALPSRQSPPCGHGRRSRGRAHS